jgi:hypothetical protein
MTRRLFAMAIMLCAALLLGACASSAKPSDALSSGYGSVKPTGTTPLAPGRTPKRGGRVEVIGTLQRDDAGAWLVIGALPSEAAGGKVIAVITNPSSLSGLGLSKLDNAYVRVTGTAAQGIATDASSLGVIADSVATITAQ